MKQQFNNNVTEAKIPESQFAGKASKEANKIMILLQPTISLQNIFLIQNMWKGPPGGKCRSGTACCFNLYDFMGSVKGNKLLTIAYQSFE